MPLVHKCASLARGWSDASSHNNGEGMSATDIEALRAFYVGTRQQLYTYAVSITGNREAAEDAIHGVFEKLLRREGLPDDLRPFVFRSVRNAAFDAWRRTRVRTDSIFAAAAADPAESESPVSSPTGEYEALLQRLSVDERETIVLKIYNGFTFQQIADVRQVPLPTVASWYRRGLEQLRTLLTAESR
jgi:RNA polymerase sigma-70 factor, ECF subfamily